MLDPNGSLLPAVSFPRLTPDVLLAYAGFGPGQELIPYFLALLTFAGAALLAVIQWPLAVMLRWRARWRDGHKDKLESAISAADQPELPGERGHTKL